MLKNLLTGGHRVQAEGFAGQGDGEALTALDQGEECEVQTARKAGGVVQSEAAQQKSGFTTWEKPVSVTGGSNLNLSPTLETKP